MSKKYKFNTIDMDAAGEITRRMDALEKRVADLTKEVKSLKESKVTRTTKIGNKTIQPKKN